MKKIRFGIGLWVALGVLTIALSACIGIGAANPQDVLPPLPPQELHGVPTATPSPVEIDDATRDGQMQEFEFVWDLVDNLYAYRDHNAADWDEIRNIYRTQIQNGMTDHQFHESMAAMVSELGDADSVYLTPDDLSARQAAIENQASMGLIGTLVALPDDVRDKVVILDVFPDSPAETAGIKPHDTIIGINGEAISDSEADEVLDRIRGEVGSEVVLTLESKRDGVRVVTVLRGEPNQVGRFDARTIDNEGSRIGYIYVPPGIDEGAAALVVTNGLRLLSRQDNIDSLILDLRVATVGNNWPVDELLGLFVHGEAYEVYNTTQDRTVSVTGKNVGGSQELPLVVLVGHDTSGTSEWFAGALQALDRATIVGGTTRGNVERLYTIPISSQSELQLAGLTARSLDGRPWGRVGVAPDIEIELLWEEFSAEADPQLDAAIDLLSS